MRGGESVAHRSPGVQPRARASWLRVQGSGVLGFAVENLIDGTFGNPGQSGQGFSGKVVLVFQKGHAFAKVHGVHLLSHDYRVFYVILQDMIPENGEKLGKIAN